MTGRHIIVVGAGIVGLCTAHALANAGVRATVIEKGPVPCPSAASTDHHRLIRHSYPDHPGYARRIGAAFEAWERLFAALPHGRGHYFAERGILTLSQQAGDYGDRTRSLFEAMGIDHERIEGADALLARFPALGQRNIAMGLVSGGGALMANRIMVDLADLLRARGVAVMEHAPAVALDAEGGRVATADGRSLSGEAIVATAGAGLPGLLPDLAGDLVYRRTVILYARPPDHLAEAWEAMPCWTDLGGADDLWGMPPIAGLPAKLGCGAMGRADAADSDRVMTRGEMDGMLARYAGAFRDLDRFEISHGQASYWMLAPGARFALRRAGRLVAASACSGHGFKFGALSGEDIAEAVLAPERHDAVAARMAADDGTPPMPGRADRA
ncbi:MAG: FAD-dependent oxidoreductase [Pseudomonadota bacterium]